MIDSKIIKIASYTQNVGLKNKFTHKCSVKNTLCGDSIKTEFIVNNSKIKSMRYETESCILCEASASLFSKKIKNTEIRTLIKEIKELKTKKKDSNYNFPKRFKEFNQLIKKKNINRFNCVILPMEAFLKAFKVR
jgi:nitrogen fixation NifU-like protein|tara:strand:- start:78 stop:482 length:405 start_codon:yes stop_codon:yes gene_type:complete